LLFLQEFKTPIIINIVIPISIIATFNLMYFCGHYPEHHVAGRACFGVGMLDDCADVVSENIFRHPAWARRRPRRPMTEYGRWARCRGHGLTTVVVFLPIIYVRGIAGPLFKDAALTVSFLAVGVNWFWL